MEFYAFKDASRPFFPLSLFPLYSRGAINNPEKLALQRLRFVTAPLRKIMRG